jgi:hypothetical protein
VTGDLTKAETQADLVDFKYEKKEELVLLPNRGHWDQKGPGTMIWILGLERDSSPLDDIAWGVDKAGMLGNRYKLNDSWELEKDEWNKAVRREGSGPPGQCLSGRPM